MPISSRNVISHIKILNRPFTRNEIFDQLLPSIYENKKKFKYKKGGKTTPSRSYQKDIQKINDVINSLIESGFLKKNKNSISIINPLHAEGTIKINAGGHGMIETESGIEIIIKKNDTLMAHNNDRVMIDLIDSFKGVFYGKVRNVLVKKHQQFIARISRVSNGIVYFQPVDINGNSEYCVEKSRFKYFNKTDMGDYLFLIKPEDKLIGYTQRCSVDNSFHIDDEEYDILRVVIKNSLPDKYPELSCIANIEETIDEKELKERTDFRKQLVVTIDGDNAKDFDDAVSLKKIGNNYTLFVHIADVSAYVKKDSSLDREAYKRGTSYYLGNRVLPMLHEKLSNELCSLKEKKDRLTVTAELSFDKDGNLIEKKFYQSIINVHKRLTYKIADKHIDNDDSSRITKMMKIMNQLAVILKSHRLQNGRLDLSLSDVELVYKNDKFHGIEYSERLRSHSIIEEFMLSANEAAAEELKKKGIPSLYRVHEKISDERLSSLINFIKTLNLKLIKSENIGISIQNVLEKVKGHENEHVVNLIVLKSMMQAFYGAEPLGHFGLGFQNYTHFTSPIRRYPDLIVHRCIKSLISDREAPYSINKLIEIGEKSSELERTAQNAERDLIRLKSCRFMKKYIGRSFKGIVSGIVKSGFFVSLIEYPIEGMVPFHMLNDDYYEIYENEYSVIGRRTNRIYKLGQKIEVKLQNVKIDRMMIDFTL